MMRKIYQYIVLPLMLTVYVGAVHAQGLAPSDAGDYVLLHSKTKEPTSTFMRLFLQGNQWMLDGKKDGGDWYPVCRANGQCQLRDSSDADIAKLFAQAPSSLHQEFEIGCIQNIAQAICRLTQKGGDETHYLMFALVTGQPIPIELKRLR